jgi:dipeptidyl aminopeptidase/acylaminoacyl peptidase
MFQFKHSSIRFLLAAGLVTASHANTSGAEEQWEKLPNGIMGQLAIFEGADGVKIAGYVRKPAGNGPFPMVVVLHGGGSSARKVQASTDEERAAKMATEAVRASNTMGRATHAPIADFLAQGWAVYSIDFRPNSRYPIDPVEFDDTLVALNKARAFPFADPKRIAMLGGSHGGHVTGRMLSRFDLCCGVLCAPAGLDLIELSRLGAKGIPLGGNQGLIRQMEQREGVKMADIEKDPAKYHYSSLLTEVSQIRCPVLMISGRNDPNAPYQVMDLYMDKVRAAGHETETYHPDNGPHGFYFGIPKTIPETAESTHRAVAFIKKHFAAVPK